MSLFESERGDFCGHGQNLVHYLYFQRYFSGDHGAWERFGGGGGGAAKELPEFSENNNGLFNLNATDLMTKLNEILLT